MHITVLCPHCQSRYQLDPALRGKRMRCPNTICQTVFEVRDESEAAPASSPPRDDLKAGPAEKPVLAGSVGDVVPMLAAEVAAPETPAARVPGPALVVARERPAEFVPPVRKPPARPPEPVPSEEPADPGTDAEVRSLLEELGIPGDDEEAAGRVSESNAPPRELAPGKWSAPPLRRAAPSRRPEEPAGRTAAPVAAGTALAAPLPGRRRRTLAVIAAMLLILGGALTAGLVVISDKAAQDEAERFQKAQDLYASQDFEEAMAAFQKLLRDFPSSPKRRHYDFLVELSAVREAVAGPRADREERARALERVEMFLEIYKNDPLLKEHHGDVWQTLQRLARELASLAEHKLDAGYLTQARRSWAAANKFTAPVPAGAEEAARALEEFTRVEKLLAAHAARLELLDALRGLAARASGEAVREGRDLARAAGREQDPDVKKLLAELVRAHRDSVVFTRAGAEPGGPAPRRMVAEGDDKFPSLYVVPQVGKVAPGGRREGIVLALARGVLYALDAAQGDVRWVRRVGVDTGVLPLRIPASTLGPELVVVLSSDSKSVAAVTAATGALVWQHTLSDVCLGQPVLVDRHLLVPTHSGRVEEIESTGGLYNGSYALGQQLVAGAVRQPGTPLVIFPADSYSVYVLDVARRKCAAILYTGHAPGALRGLPLVWNEGPASDASARGSVSGWLLMCLASGNDGVELRPYSLPVRSPDQKSAAPLLKVRGDTSAAPWHDEEKLALATDAGVLSLYGIRQPGNRDPLLFPLVNEEYRLENENRARQARALVVHADTQNYWVLSGGRLHRLQAIFTAQSGPGLVARWPQPVEVGSPLHAGQVHVGTDGRFALVVVTQELGKPTCWARAVDAGTGQVLWQRQLGIVCQDRLAATGDAVLALDGSGLFRFDALQPGKDQAGKDRHWQAAGTFLDATAKETAHWVGVRGAGFVHLAWRSGSALQVRLVNGQGAVVARSLPLPAPPHGTPALGTDSVLIPLANGIVFRVPLGDGPPLSGPHWRGIGIEESEPGHVVALGAHDFVVSDGGRTLLRIHWGDAESSERGTTELSHRITAAPVVLGKRIVLADASDTVTLLEGERLQPTRHWILGGRISAGPFVRGQGVGVVVSKNRLVWLDPDKDAPAWEYTFVAPIVGQPELVDGVLVVADLQGGIIGLDPATGTPLGDGYRLRSNQAASAAPVPFGSGQVFLPLMDGTIMVVPVQKLR